MALLCILTDHNLIYFTRLKSGFWGFGVLGFWGIGGIRGI